MASICNDERATSGVMSGPVGIDHRRSVQLGHKLGIEVAVEGLAATLAADAAVLDAAERCLGQVPRWLIDTMPASSPLARAWALRVDPVKA